MAPPLMKKEEYNRFRLVVNIFVFLAFLLVFFFVEIKNVQQGDVMSSLVATVFLSALLMLLGILTIFPGFSAYFGKTLVVFSMAILLGVIVQITYSIFTLFMLIEIVLAIAAFLYGKELITQKQGFVSLKLIAGHTKKKKR